MTFGMICVSFFFLNTAMTGKLCFYDSSPLDGDIPFPVFESAGYRRLHVLHVLWENKGKDKDSLRRKVIAEYLPLKTEENILHDRVSHYLLCLVFSFFKEDWSWFVAAEQELFHQRLQHAPSELDNLLKSYEKVPPSDWDDSLYEMYSRKKPILYKLPFEQALPLIKAHAVVLKEGFAYVPRPEMRSVLVKRLGDSVRSNLARAEKNVTVWCEGLVEEVVDGISRHVPRIHRKEIPSLGVEASQLSTLSKYMPRCMAKHMEEIIGTGKAKHSIRTQFGFFMKAIGVTKDGAIAFWRAHLAVHDFDKQYLPELSHHYSKNYQPFTCRKLIDLKVCPYVGKGNPQAECAKDFEETFGKKLERVSPLDYFATAFDKSK